MEIEILEIENARAVITEGICNMWAVYAG